MTDKHLEDMYHDMDNASDVFSEPPPVKCCDRMSLCWVSSESDVVVCECSQCGWFMVMSESDFYRLQGHGKEV